ncbi:DUF2062 domain-containing protein [Rubellimicrobium sp. CFH 75288]|uniref:DUF2062 domain-containing protein n=1 Tax=Rubellimicrobium sp. CFH 75288 TaxID=2697034 RepID=UPI0014128170|nr:DUF2062 domain-containing protein [Rubellimicrobium sp. CFH 75288]NAZ38083.1 DUF2062 domain-containing protein [Rubellimicrobium sp. CFH 75288]
MVFRRRDRRPPLRALREALWPRGGWGRAVGYMSLRLRRLPDSPEKIARGIAAGVIVSFTPLYGLHFVLSMALAWAIRGNIVASLIGTFINNPATIVPISALCMALGYWILGLPLDRRLMDNLGQAFAEGLADVWTMLVYPFTGNTPDWVGLRHFAELILIPYFVGGILPGLVATAICYWLTVGIVRAYQAARRRKLQARLQRLAAPEE